jgi:hypothetical protein
MEPQLIADNLPCLTYVVFNVTVMDRSSSPKTAHLRGVVRCDTVGCVMKTCAKLDITTFQMRQDLDRSSYLTFELCKFSIKKHRFMETRGFSLELLSDTFVTRVTSAVARDAGLPAAAPAVRAFPALRRTLKEVAST